MFVLSIAPSAAWGVGTAGTRMPHVFMYHTREKWEIAEEDHFSDRLRVTLPGYHTFLLVYLLESAQIQEKTQVA